MNVNTQPAASTELTSVINPQVEALDASLPGVKQGGRGDRQGGSTLGIPPENFMNDTSKQRHVFKGH